MTRSSECSRQAQSDETTTMKNNSEQARLYPLARPVGHVPVIDRYSARFSSDTSHVIAMFMGVQGSSEREIIASGFEEWIKEAMLLGDAPSHFDRARFEDERGALNRLAALYWSSEQKYRSWMESPVVARWLSGEAAIAASCGIWWEPVAVSSERMETITFENCLRGASACPFVELEPTDRTGYWGAARDRIPASGNDRLSGPTVNLDYVPHSRPTHGARISIQPPKGLAVIRSGVSWEACGEQQLRSFEKNIRPKLDEGMKYLRQHPLESGCCSLRQVILENSNGIPMKEAYSLGAFLSLAHLENWAKFHPTHLAIYHRAMAERKRYQNRLELRTYNEIYVIDDKAHNFEYINCHDGTGLVPFFPACK